ncbi:hypothetical protein KRX57_07710 [Weeksellaceae bacterium TAE3-ERU29]|nr:hypothetical protein [Weeksellaceae bacterium TAE3-ERU29]
MKNTIILLFITMLFQACSPTLSQLKSFDSVVLLKENGLLVSLPNTQVEQETYKKYGQSEKAKKLAEKTNEKVKKIMNAFTNNYTFSSVGFSTETKPKYNYIAQITESEIEDSNDRLKKITEIKIIDNENNILEKAFVNGQGRYDNLIKSINKKLWNKYNKAQKYLK